MTSRIQLIHVVQLGLLIGSPVDNQRWLSQWGNHKQQVKEKRLWKMTTSTVAEERFVPKQRGDWTTHLVGRLLFFCFWQRSAGWLVSVSFKVCLVTCVPLLLLIRGCCFVLLHLGPAATRCGVKTWTRLLRHLDHRCYGNHMARLKNMLLPACQNRDTLRHTGNSVTIQLISTTRWRDYQIIVDDSDLEIISASLHSSAFITVVADY